MTTARNKYEFQLYEQGGPGSMDGRSIESAGGVVMVCVAGDPSKVAITDADGTALSNPMSLTRGHAVFYTLATVLSVDLFIQCPDGQFRVVSAATPNTGDIGVDVRKQDQQMVIPFAGGDLTATTETATGFTEPTNALFLSDSSGMGVRVTTVQSAKTLDVGTLSSDTGDADGFISAVSLATAGIVLDQGALMTTLVGHISGGKSITVTSSSGTTVAEGYIYLPYRLMNQPA